MKVSSRVHQMISIQTGLLHDSDVCVCLLQCGEFIMVVWQTNGKKLGNLGYHN